ncbi:universal stress protein [Myxococcota bacterium]|nr:universal stress protein [Myxococcota bacterium]MBU1536209.1 universal stress protein [Myxococcota bacterium]
MKIAINKILCPVDFSDNADHALQYALAFAQAHDAELTLIHAVENPVLVSLDYPVLPYGNVNDLAKSAQHKLDEILVRIKQEHEKVLSKVTIGTPFIEIIQYARNHEVDMIVLGTHGKSGLAHVLMGSVSERVVRKAPCPVLTIKHPEHEFVMP